MTSQTTDMQHEVAEPCGNVQITVEETINLTRRGESGLLVVGDDLRLHAVTHLTVNANGVPTSQKNDLRSECR